MAEPLDCEEAIGRLFEFLDRELDPALEREMERHLAACRGCFSRAEFERRLRERVTEASRAEAPPRLRERVQLIIGRFTQESRRT